VGRTLPIHPQYIVVLDKRLGYRITEQYEEKERGGIGIFNSYFF